MTDQYEKVIQQQKEVIACLEKQHMADQVIMDSQKQQICILEEKISLLEKEQQKLINAGNELAAACEKLEKICSEQQKLLESFSRTISEQ